MEREDAQERFLEKQERYLPHEKRHLIPQWWCAICQRNGTAPLVVRRTSHGAGDGLPF